MTTQLLRFGLVGVAGYAVDAGVLYASLGLGLGTGSGRLVSFLCAVLATWLLNRRFTFVPSSDAPDGQSLLQEWLKYLAAMSVGGVLNLCTYALIMASMAYHPALPALAVAAGSLVGMLANFAGAKWWVYRKPAQTYPIPRGLLGWHVEYSIFSQGTCFWVALALILLCFKIFVLALTPLPQFFLGDSASYLHSALTNWVPNDRSYWYGVWIRKVVSDTQSLVPLLIAQAVVSAGTAFFAACWAQVIFKPARWILVLIAVVCALDPSQLLMERYVMTETLTLFFVALVFLFLAFLILKGNWQWMCLAVLSAVAVMALRFSLMPVIATVLLTAPLLGLWARSFTCRDGLIALLVALLVVPFGLKFSRDLQSGKFVLAAWSPKLQHSDFQNPEIAARVLNDVSLENTDLFAREVNLWGADGLIHHIERVVPEEMTREHVYIHTAMQILTRDPMGVFNLGWDTYRNLWRPEVRQRLVEWDIGQQAFDIKFRNVLLKSFRLPVDEMPQPTILSRYYGLLAPLTALLGLITFALIPLCSIGLERKQVAAMLLLSFASFALVLIICFLTTLPVIRYLHPMGWILSAACLPAVIGRIKSSHDRTT